VNYVRVARDQRGYETTMLLHSPRPGERPRVLYWYRTAPGVRVGRAPLDEEAIRTIEERHPDIEFDWAQLFEEASNLPPDVERRPERPRRKVPRPKETMPADAAPVASAVTVDEPAAEVRDTAFESNLAVSDLPAHPPEPEAARPAPYRSLEPTNPLLDQLVGREIATRLRARYDEVATRIDGLAASEVRSAWQARADALNPDRWSSPEAILTGIQNADRLFDELKRELP
jgi:hypothetical protein